MIKHASCVLLSLAVVAAIASDCARPGHGGEVTRPDTTRADTAIGRPRPVTSEDIRRRPGEPVENLLMDRFPGVTVMRTADGTIAIQIRGGSSLLGSNEPLYVVDGIAVQPGPTGGLVGVSPYDIESIQVLKDPASTAMYGVRGANGVILIKTKRPDQ